MLKIQGLTVLAAGLLGAASVSSAAGEGPHAALAEALAPSDVVDALVDSYLEQIFEQMALDPDMAELESDCPGLFATGRGALRDAIEKSNESRIGAYRVAVTDLLAREMPAGEAEEALAFYRSDYVLARKASASGSLDWSEIAEAIVRGEDEASVEGQAEAELARAQAQNRLFDGPSGAEIHRQVSQRPWFRTLLRLQPTITELRREVKGRAFSPEEQQRMDQALESAVYTHVQDC